MVKLQTFHSSTDTGPKPGDKRASGPTGHGEVQLKHNPRDVNKGCCKRATKKAIGNPERGKEGDVFILQGTAQPWCPSKAPGSGDLEGQS
jgi:hypothetical protein